MSQKKINILLSIEEYACICELLSTDINRVKYNTSNLYNIDNFKEHQEKIDFHIKLTNKFRKKLKLNKIARFIIPSIWWDEDSFEPN